MKIEYKTIDSNELAPYPNMTQDNLDDFEAWSSAVENSDPGLQIFAVGVLAIIVIIIISPFIG